MSSNTTFELFRVLVQEIVGEELVQALQIKRKIPRRKALSLLEEKVLDILTEKGYVSCDATPEAHETIAEILEDEDEDEEVVVDGEVDEGDVHIKPTSRKATPLVQFNPSLVSFFLFIFPLLVKISLIPLLSGFHWFFNLLYNCSIYFVLLIGHHTYNHEIERNVS